MITRLKTTFAAIGARRRAVADFHALQSMDDALLRDIGVTRADIDAAFRRQRFIA